MNQILMYKNMNKNKTILCFILFLFFIFILIILMFYCILHFTKINKNQIKAKNLKDSYNITKLYNQNINYNISRKIYINPYIIGKLKIDKLDIEYPILSVATEENLKKSLCRFAGPMPNEIGNLCIAGHNYLDNSFFGRLYLLNINDLVTIFDYYGNKKEYKLIEIKEIDNNDLSCTNQQTNNKRIVTLMTCSSLDSKRTIYIGEEI